MLQIDRSGKGEDYNERRHMEEVIASGRSVLKNGQIFTSIEHLPSEADLAKGDPAKEAEARARLQEQVDALNAELAKLQAGQAVEDDRGSDDVRPFDEMTRSELKAIAQFRGLSFPGNISNADLVTLLKGSDQGPAVEPPPGEAAISGV